MVIKLGGKRNDVRRMPENENWHVLVAGSIPPHPSEMLGSTEMKELIAELSADYDFIIVDLPPVNIVSDALIASEYLDGVIVVVRQDYSKRREVNKCVKQLELAGARVLGFVMGSVSESRGSYKKKSEYGYGGYGVRGSESTEAGDTAGLADTLNNGENSADTSGDVGAKK